MTTIYPTAVPSEGGEPDSDLDATQRGFDVYEAYQRALADEEVSPKSSIADECRILNPDIQISPPLAAILSLTELVTRSDGTARHRLAPFDTSHSL